MVRVLSEAGRLGRHSGGGDVAAGFLGVKLLPVNMAYRLSDPTYTPFFDKLKEFGLPCKINYGVSVDATSDLRFADPIDFSPVARDLVLRGNAAHLFDL